MKKILYVISMILWASMACSLTYMNAANADTYVNITLISQTPDPVEPGQYVDLRFKVENWGSETVEDIELELLAKFPFSLEPGESSFQSIGSLQGRQTGKKGVIVKFRLKVDEEAVEGENEIELKYTTGEFPGSVLLEPFIVNVQTHDAIIAVESVESSPNKIAPGQEGLLTIEIKNMADSLLKEVKATLNVREIQATSTSVTTTEYPFTPIGSSNEKTLAMLKPGATEDIQFRLIADPDAESKIYRVPLLLEYSDELGANYSKSLIVGMIIGDEPDLVVNLDSSTIRTSGQRGTVTLRFVNKGTNNIKFAYIGLEEKDDYEIIGAKNVYIGQIDSDDYETVDFELYVPKTDSDVALHLSVEYKDANNQDYSTNIQVPIVLYNAAEAKRYGLVQGNSGLGFFIIVLIVAAGLFVYWRWKKKKKK